MEKSRPLITRFPVPGDNTVEKVRYTEPGQGEEHGGWPLAGAAEQRSGE